MKFAALPFIAMTVFCWGIYGPVLHKGQIGMDGSRLRPLLCVGLAYFAIAVVVPIVVLSTSGETGTFSLSGIIWSSVAGLAGVGGALGRIRGEPAEGKGTLAKSETGVILAVRVAPDTATTAEDVLRATGASSIERVEGDWQDGEWRDFDPVRRPGEPASGANQH